MTAKHGGPGRGQGRKRLTTPKRHVISQRYTDPEINLIESVAGPGAAVGEFIKGAAIDRAQQFADSGLDVLHQAITYDKIRDYIEDDEMGVS